MGAIISKIVNHTSEPKVVQPEGAIFEDPRSPTDGVHRTPLNPERKPYLETDIDNVTPTIPLRVKLLKRVTDPRSPSAGINRTPLSLLSSEEFGSPVSVYSTYHDDLESVSCLPSPFEPSVNVSDFEAEQFSKELDSLVNQLNISLPDEDPIPPEPETFVPLTLHTRKPQSVLSFETKQICEDLIQEIIESFKECEGEMSKPVEKPKLSLAPNSETPQLHRKKSKKSRKPLANITSAGNTPTKLKNTKDSKFIKVDQKGENSPLAAVAKGRVQWDQDATIVI